MNYFFLLFFKVIEFKFKFLVKFKLNLNLSFLLSLY